MIWIIGGLFFLLFMTMLSVCINKVTKMENIMSAQRTDIFMLRESLEEFQKHNSYHITDWGKELKVLILSLQADYLRRNEIKPAAVKKDPVVKKKIKRAFSEEAKKKASMAKKEWWAQKKREKEDSPSLFQLNSN